MLFHSDSKLRETLVRTGTAVLCLILLTAFLLPVLPVPAVAEKTVVRASGVDTTRGTGQLIIYTSAYGARTNTNEWGYEACVGADHIVKSVGGNNSVIPEGGFVLSGHDEATDTGMKTWIRNNVKVGQYVYYNPLTLEVTVSDKEIKDADDAFYSVQHAVTGVNGTRSENAMMIYTNGGRKTGTNEYGSEVTVRDGLVESIGGNDNLVPKDGFVVSGHGTSADWLRNNVKIGMSCVYDSAKKTVTFTMDDQSLLAGLKHSIDLAVETMEAAKESYLYMDYAAFEEKRAAALSAHEKVAADYKKSKDKSQLVSDCDALRTQIADLNNLVSESVTVQYRAAWLRPSQHSASEVDSYVEQLHQKGINTLCVEGIFDSTVIMNVPEGSLFAHNPSFTYDVLQAYVDACHKRNMECHLWMAICHVSSINGTNYIRSLAKKKPEWLAKNNKGTYENENNFLMIDPANAEARAYLISFYEYIVRNYDIDGFELDYIRYCDNGELDFGYTDAAIQGFREAYDTDVTPEYNSRASYWNDWVQYRCDCITGFVRDISAALKKINPGIVIAADVVPNMTVGKNRNYQDYQPWIKAGYLDVLHPMAYGDGFDDQISAQVKAGGSLCAVAVGLGVFEPVLGADDMVKQAIRDNRLAAIGDVYFEASSFLKDKAGEALLATVYRTEAISPFLDPDASIRTALDYLLNHAKEVILPFGGLTDAEYTALESAVAAAQATVKDCLIGGEQLSALNTVIRKLEDKKAYAALNTDLSRAVIIATVYNKCTWADLMNGTVEKREPADESSESPVSEPSGEVSQAESAEPPAESSEATESELAESNAPAASASGLPLWGWILIILGVLILAGCIALLVRGMKSRKNG